MSYVIIFLGGLVSGYSLGLLRSYQLKMDYIKQLRKELNLPAESPAEVAGKDYLAKAGITDPYAQGETARAEYKEATRGTMWGRKGEQ